MSDFNVPLVIRGQVITGAELEFGGRNGGVRFSTPDLKQHLHDLPVSTPSSLSDLYELSFAEILDYLDAVGKRLVLKDNPHLQAAYELSVRTSGLGPEMLRSAYDNMGALFARESLRASAQAQVGIDFLEGWVEIGNDQGYRAAVRAFGARSVHIVAGNSPIITAVSIARNALVRSDAVIKTPSNDPLTAAAIARTMVELDPQHPITKHLSVAYWKGGDAEIEDFLYQPRHVEKIVAWGGLASISHISKYIQPGIDLITLDPKLSSSIVGSAAFASSATMQDAARRLALDIGGANQEGCVCARVVYIQTGTDSRGLADADAFGRLVYDEIQRLPVTVSTPARTLDPVLAQEMEGLRFAGDAFTVIGGGRAGAVIVSHDEDPVDFAALLTNRVANLVPVDDLDTPVRAVTAYTQTIGVYPDELAVQLRDRLAIHGGQRLVSLGYATGRAGASVGPQDGIEPLRRMCKWIVHERFDPELRPLLRAPDPTPATV